MAIQKPKNILIAPLDWGLGHTTRCVPLIRHIQGLGHRVFVAGNEWQRSFIKATFEHIDIIDLEGYNVTYSKWNRFAQIGILAQLPGLHRTIGAEHNWMKKVAKDLQIDGIISDNRYGLFHPDIPSVIMTHQLQVRTGMGNVVDRSVQKIHYKYLDRFAATWVVDTANAPGLGGTLSHTNVMPQRAEYVGLLSQFENVVANNDTNDSLLILLSGPEPQRSELSHMLWQQVQGYNGKVTFVEGSNKGTTPDHIPSHVTYHKWLANEALSPLLHTAGMIICRSGYSTLMDLVALQKKAILIPTPGQTEQEYLAKHLYAQGVFYTAKQTGFDLDKTLTELKQFPFHAMALQDAYADHKKVVSDWLNAL